MKDDFLGFQALAKNFMLFSRGCPGRVSLQYLTSTRCISLREALVDIELHVHLCCVVSSEAPASATVPVV